MTDRLLAAAAAVCDRRGYDVTAPGRPWLPPRLADPSADATPFVAGTATTRVAIEPVHPTEATPTMLLSRLRNNAGNDRFSLFVVDDAATARSIRSVLSDPPLVAAEDPLGRRTFYTGLDRVPLADGGYAAVRTDVDPADLVWREVGADDSPALVLVDGDTSDRGADDATGTLGGDDHVLAHLDGVDALACPDADRFPYSYERDPDDKRFRVRSSERTVGVYGGVASLRANAYVPVPMPLVPEHVFDGVASVRDAWAALVVSDAESDHSSPDTVTLVTADGPRAS